MVPPIPQPDATPKVISDQLSALRRKLTGWVAVHGLGRWLGIVCGLIAADVVIDRYFQMDTAQRLIMLVGMLVVAAMFFLSRVIRPLLQRSSDDALIHQVESRHGGQREQIISSVQLARQQGFSQTGASETLAAATVQAGIEKAAAIDFTQSLDRSQHFKDLGILAGTAGFVGLLAICIFATPFFSTWFSRNIMLSSDQWPQPTYLEIANVVDGKLVLPLGTKHQQIVTVSESSSVTDVDVALEVEGVSGKRTIYPMTPTGKLDGRERVFEINVTNEFRFRASTDNDVTTDWVEVTYVEPPSVQQLDLRVTLPAYTGLEPVQLSGNGPHGVLDGSRLHISASINKPLQSATLLAAGLENSIAIDPKNPQSISITLPTPSTDGVADRSTNPSSARSLSGGEYELKLSDLSGLGNIRRSKFSITIKEDRPPKLRADLLGISGLVTPQATLPVEFQVTDDYGLSQLFFDCSWKTGEKSPTQEKQLAFDGLPPTRPAVSARDVGVLELRTLKLSPGTSFRLTIGAQDTRPDQPGVSSSQEFLLRVVSDAELRADLLRREIEQRKAFEQIYQTQLELTSEIQAVAASERSADTDEATFHRQRESKLISMIRSQKGIGTSVDRIANRFENYLVEVKNNHLDEAENELAPSQRIEKRFDEKIIQPIGELDREFISLATRSMDNCRRTESNQAELDGAVDKTVAIQTEILDRMRVILDAMNNSENFQEILNEMLEIKTINIEVAEGVKKLRNDKKIVDDQDIDDIFDE